MLRVNQLTGFGAGGGRPGPYSMSYAGRDFSSGADAHRQLRHRSILFRQDRLHRGRVGPEPEHHLLLREWCRLHQDWRGDVLFGPRVLAGGRTTRRRLGPHNRQLGRLDVEPVCRLGSRRRGWLEPRLRCGVRRRKQYEQCHGELQHPRRRQRLCPDARFQADGVRRRLRRVQHGPRQPEHSFVGVSYNGGGCGGGFIGPNITYEANVYVQAYGSDSSKPINVLAIKFGKAP